MARVFYSATLLVDFICFVDYKKERSCIVAVTKHTKMLAHPKPSIPIECQSRVTNLVAISIVYFFIVAMNCSTYFRPQYAWNIYHGTLNNQYIMIYAYIRYMNVYVLIHILL